MTLKTAFLIIMSMAVGSVLAQNDVKELDKARFRSIIVNQWWSSENQDNKKDCDMRLLMIKPDGFEFNCINWANGFSGCKCAYDLKVQDGFFELAMKDCPNKFNVKFMYGYLSEKGDLLLLLREKPLALSPGLLSEKDWVRFEKITR